MQVQAQAGLRSELRGIGFCIAISADAAPDSTYCTHTRWHGARCVPHGLRSTLGCCHSEGKERNAKKEFEQELATSSMDSNILDYCSLDNKVRLQQNASQCVHSALYARLVWCSIRVQYVHALRITATERFLLHLCCRQGARPTTKRSLGEKEQEYLDALRVTICTYAGSERLPIYGHAP